MEWTVLSELGQRKRMGALVELAVYLLFLQHWLVMYMTVAIGRHWVHIRLGLSVKRFRCWCTGMNSLFFSWCFRCLNMETIKIQHSASYNIIFKIPRPQTMPNNTTLLLSSSPNSDIYRINQTLWASFDDGVNFIRLVQLSASGGYSDLQHISTRAVDGNVTMIVCSNVICFVVMSYVSVLYLFFVCLLYHNEYVMEWISSLSLFAMNMWPY